MLSRTTEYALRALVYLAQQPPDRVVLGSELSSMLDIPGNYLSKIMLAIKRLGILKATRGPKGGYHLTKLPDQIHLLEVVKAFAGEPVLPNCFLRNSRSCSDEQPCSAHPAWREVKLAYESFLLNTTLDQIAKTAEGLPVQIKVEDKSSSTVLEERQP